MNQLHITTLQPSDRRAIRKTVEFKPGPDGQPGVVEKITDFPRIYLWTRRVNVVDFDIDELGAFISRTAEDPHLCIVSGEPCGELPLDHPVPRLKNPGPKDPPSLAECAAPWHFVDLDSIPISGRLDPCDPEPAVAEVVAMLEEPFASASYVWQLTSVASPLAPTIRARVYFLVDRAITNDERRRWAQGLNSKTGIKLADPALYTATQPIYTATPEFMRSRDPFTRRIGVTYGEFETVPWSRVQIHPLPKRGVYDGTKWGGQTPPSIAEALECIGDHPGGDGFHVAINMAVWWMVKAKWTTERIIATILDTVAKADKSKHTTADIRERTSIPKIKRSIEGADRRIRQEELRPRVTQTPVFVQTVSIAEAQQKIDQVATDAVAGRGPKKVALKVTVGVGKTRRTLDAIAKTLRPGQVVLWAAPTHVQGDEVLDRGRDFGLSALKIEGRIKDDTAPLCTRPDIIKAIVEAGLARQTSQIACEHKGVRCPAFHECAYQAQFKGHEQLRLLPHKYLTLGESRAWSQVAGEVACTIIDESPLNGMTGHRHYKLEDLPPGVLAETIEAWFASREPPEGTKEALQKEFDARCRPDDLFHTPGGRDENELLMELRHIRRVRTEKFAALYISAIQRLEGDVNLVWPSLDRKSVWCAWKHAPPKSDRLLVLDAAADPEIYECLFGGQFEINEVNVAQNLEIIQVSDAAVGKGRLLSDDSLLRRIAALTRSTGSAFIGNKAVAEKMLANGWLTEATPIATFGALRGLNALEHCDSLVICGRPEPDVLVVEAIARALKPRADLKFTGRYVWRNDGIGLVASHEDPFIDRVLRAIREAEIAQAMGRLRAVWSATPKRVIVLTHTPIAGNVRSALLDEILPSAKLADLLFAGAGVAVLSPKWMAKMCPEAWPTEGAAKVWLHRERVTLTQKNNSNSLKASVTLKSAAFRLAGQRCPSRLLTLLTPAETRSKIESLTGRRVVDLRFDEADQTAEAPVSDKTVTIQVANSDGTTFAARVLSADLPAVQEELDSRGMRVSVDEDAP